MKSFSTGDLSRKIGDVTHTARHAPIVITQHNKPRFVLMTIEAYELMCGNDSQKAGADA
jgi:prevent-host-death family protein